MEKEKSNLFVIIDGSSMLVTQYFGTLPDEVKFAKTDEEKEKYYSKIMQSESGEYTNGIYGMCMNIMNLMKDINPKYLAVVFDKSRDTFRREMFSDYKGQRKSTPDPLRGQFKKIEKILIKSNIKVFFEDEYEADDLAGSLASAFAFYVPVRLITKDRDYLQLVDDNADVECWIVGTRDAADEFRKKYRPAETDVHGYLRNIMRFTNESVLGEKGVYPVQIPDLKGIEGDVADNIPGVKGVSSAAAPLIMEYGSVEDIYKAIHKCETPKEEKELVKFWKDKLGIKRSPLKPLREQEESAMLSKELATIVTNIQIDADISDFETGKINKDIFNEELNKLDIKTIRL